MKNQWSLILIALPFALSALSGSALAGPRRNALAQKETKEVQLLGDVVVPVPPQIKKYGHLLVKGTPGTNQRDTGILLKCEKGEDGTPKKFSCKGAGNFKLNELSNVYPGYYRIIYGMSMTLSLVEIGENSTTEISLRKIEIPDVDANFDANIFWDVSSPLMQDLALSWKFSSEVEKESVKKLCSSTPKSNRENIKAACEAWSTDDHRSLAISVLRFTNDGKVSILDYDGSFDKPGRFLIDSTVSNGDFVSVFPGVYGITFTDLETNEPFTKLHINVE
ncbi:MAG: hypothetical protein ACXVCR_11385 [Bdellovibrio sp.]